MLAAEAEVEGEGERERGEVGTARARPRWTPHLDGERVVEGIHYGWLMRDHLARYRLASEYCFGKRVADVGTGTGYGASILRRNGAVEVVAVDHARGPLEYARYRYGTDGLRWVRADVSSLPFGAEFDVVVSFETLGQVSDPERLVGECRRILKPGGLFLASTAIRVDGARGKRELGRDDLQRVLAAHFPRVHLLGQRRELSLVIRPLGSLPDRYWQARVQAGRGSHRLFTVMDRINKAPNLLLAWALGMNDTFRGQFGRLDGPLRQSSLLKPHYYVMLAVCQLELG
jgi:SAM-dependent methyltransferase